MELEPITRKEKIIAGKDLQPVTRMEFFLKAYGGGGSGGGGSADAVLYTAQTLTDAQKQQARDNIDAAIGDFQVTATIQNFPTCTLDKTFNQIQEAISKGKRVFARLNISSDNAFILELLSSTSTEIEFTAFDYNYGYGLAQAYKLVVRPDKAEIAAGDAPTFVSKGTLPQVKMAAGPSLDMEIATKKYVDNKECILKSTTPGSTKKFKITVDDSGNISATEVT